ncbi:MAG: hypothetical protein FD165_1276 [Gammaproteobacteria bacterium]|nr:MAG: hypothetical protein FD165_1276 [Gammaproteobacteria bacterium]TND05775.1 MAG: hypothetical protein FD120_988 [Gammaproteobacteria bacterium]
MTEPATLPEAVTSAIETALNGYLGLDPELARKLAPLAGKVVAIELRGINLMFYFQVANERLRVLSVYDGVPDTTLRGTPLTMAWLGLSATSSELLFSGDVEIDGDAELGQRFKKLLDSIDIDWEEQLSRVVGDIVAHQAAVNWRNISGWARQAFDTLRRDTAEYFQEESRDLPTRDEVDAYLAGIDAIRADADRLEQRVARLTRRLRGPGDRA